MEVFELKKKNTFYRSVFNMFHNTAKKGLTVLQSNSGAAIGLYAGVALLVILSIVIIVTIAPGIIQMFSDGESYISSTFSDTLKSFIP
jgi:hypothetical protein